MYGLEYFAHIITALLAREMLERYPGANILHDLRSSRSVREEIEKYGGTPYESAVGHVTIKHLMREKKAIFGGEYSAHYYFDLDGYIAERGALPAILLLNLMARTGKPLSALIREVHRFAHSGEHNFRVNNISELMERVKNQYSDGALSTLDGIKIVYPNWWFSLRASNTEPLVRLNLEAIDETHLNEKLAEIRALIAV